MQCSAACRGRPVLISRGRRGRWMLDIRVFIYAEGEMRTWEVTANGPKWMVGMIGFGYREIIM